MKLLSPAKAEEAPTHLTRRFSQGRQSPRTPRGRMVTQQCWSYLGLPAPKDAPLRQLDLLGPPQEGADDGE